MFKSGDDRLTLLALCTSCRLFGVRQIEDLKRGLVEAREGNTILQNKADAAAMAAESELLRCA